MRKIKSPTLWPTTWMRRQFQLPGRQKHVSRNAQNFVVLGGKKVPLRCKAGKAYPVPPPLKLNRWGVPIMEKLVPWDPLVEVARSKPMFFKCPSKEPCVLYKTTVPDHLRGQMSQQPPGKKRPLPRPPKINGSANKHCQIVPKPLPTVKPMRKV